MWLRGAGAGHLVGWWFGVDGGYAEWHKHHGSNLALSLVA